MSPYECGMIVVSLLMNEQLRNTEVAIELLPHIHPSLAYAQGTGKGETNMSFVEDGPER